MTEASGIHCMVSIVFYPMVSEDDHAGACVSCNCANGA